MNKKIKAIKERWKGSKTLEDWSGQTKEDIDYLIAEYERLEKKNEELIRDFDKAVEIVKRESDENGKLQRIVACAEKFSNLFTAQEIKERQGTIGLDLYRELQQAIKERKS